MKLQPSGYRFTTLGLVLLSSLTAPLFVHGQSPTGPNGPSQREMQAREWTLTHIPDDVNKHFQKEQISLFAQIREDFTRLQVINNEMLRSVFVNRSVDRNLIVATTAEINKRAVRLSASLALPKIDEKKARSQKSDEARNDRSLQAGLLALDRCIMSFVTNPLFKQPKVIDPQDALRARSDLNLIIRLSEQLRTSLTNQLSDSHGQVVSR